MRPASAKAWWVGALAAVFHAAKDAACRVAGLLRQSRKAAAGNQQSNRAGGLRNGIAVCDLAGNWAVIPFSNEGKA